MTHSRSTEAPHLLRNPRERHRELILRRFVPLLPHRGKIVSLRGASAAHFDETQPAVAAFWAHLEIHQHLRNRAAFGSLTSKRPRPSCVTCPFSVRMKFSCFDTSLSHNSSPSFTSSPVAFAIANIPPHSPTPVRVLTVHGATGAKANC